MPLSSTDGNILCGFSTGARRPLVLDSHRQIVVDSHHSLFRPGVVNSVKLTTTHFFWPEMSQHITAWALPSQRSKVHRHIHAPLGRFDQPDTRLCDIHTDLVVGPAVVDTLISLHALIDSLVDLRLSL